MGGRFMHAGHWLIGSVDLGLLADLTRHPYRLQAEQWKYTRLVWETLQREHADVAGCHFSHAVRGVYDTGDGIEVLVWVDEGGGRGHEEVMRGSYLVGCDGADSVVRRAVGIPFEGFTYPERFVVVSTPFPMEQSAAMAWCSGRGSRQSPSRRTAVRARTT